MNSTIKQRTPVRRRRPGKPRRGPLRDAKYRRWVALQWCCVPPQGHETVWGRVEAAHTQNNGMSSKGPDSSCVPLCPSHHREYDAGRKAFDEKYGINLKAIAAQYWAEFNREMGRDGKL